MKRIERVFSLGPKWPEFPTFDKRRYNQPRPVFNKIAWRFACVFLNPNWFDEALNGWAVAGWLKDEIPDRNLKRFHKFPETAKGTVISCPMRFLMTEVSAVKLSFTGAWRRNCDAIVLTQLRCNNKTLHCSWSDLVAKSYAFLLHNRCQPWKDGC